MTASAAAHELPATLHGLLARAAERFPRRTVRLLDARGRSAGERRFAELPAAVARTAAALYARGVRPGRPTLLALPTGWGWLDAWFGTLALGGLPAAVAPAGALGASEAQLVKLDGLLERLGSEHLVCSAALAEAAARLGVARVAAAALPIEGLADWPSAAPPPPPAADQDEVAYLQLTSGSTGQPRAVTVTHRNAIANAAAIEEIIGRPHGAPAGRWADAWVSWLPLHHDMGLVGCVIGSLLSGLDLWLLPPRAFLSRPQLWLERLARCGAAIATAPNFGYQLCAERVPPAQLAGSDLSHWRVALCGSEMVRCETVASFRDAFAGHGFSPAAFRPCYGLAEATLAVTVDARGAGPRSLPQPDALGSAAAPAAAPVVCVGEPVRDTRLRITAPDGSELGPGRIGAVEVAGPGVCPGYWNDAQASAETVVDGWLRTGDLGFLHDGELYLTGRSKELLIVHGQNIMPEELERQADATSGGGGLLRSAAFSVTRGPRGEEAVLVVEVEDPPPTQLVELEREIRRRIGLALELPLADVVLVRRGRIPRTSSGKLRRGELRQRYLAGTIDRLG